MDRDEAVERLPVTYQRIIALLDADEPPDEIAKRLDIDPSEMPALITLATAKLERATDDPTPTDSNPMTR
jgi:DNA-directed RNA polymerase specialized sigma24 family protein